MRVKLSICLLAFLNFGYAQESITFQKPSADILKLADYERAPSVFMDSNKEWLIFSYRNTYKSLDDLNQEEMKLAGLRINPITNISSSMTYVNNLKIRKINDKTEVQVKGLPANPKIAFTTFSPDEKKLAFTNTVSNGVELWVLDLTTATAKKISNANLNANLGSPFVWYKDSENLDLLDFLEYESRKYFHNVLLEER